MQKQVNWAPLIAGQAGVVPLSLGIPGVAKTAFFEALAEATGRRFVPYMLDQVLPEDLRGFPTLREVEIAGQRRSAMVCFPDADRLRAELEDTVVLLDELTCAPQHTQAAALQWINEPSRRSWMFAAANPPEQAAAGVALAPPMVNRLCVVDWETPIAAIREGWRNGLEFPQPVVPRLPAGWLGHAAKWGCLLDEYIGKFPDALEQYPSQKARASNPFPTPRSWTNVIRLLSAAESVDANKHVRNILIEGCVGSAAGMQFRAFLDESNLPGPEEILADPRGFTMPRRGDLAIALVRSVRAAVEADCTDERWYKLCEVWDHVWSQSKEIGMATYGRVTKIMPVGCTPPRYGGWGEMVAVRSGM